MDLFKSLGPFLRPDPQAEFAFKNLTKELFDNAKQQEGAKHAGPVSGQVNSLVVDCMDDEGIWTQLDIENQQFLKSYIKEFCQNERPDEEDNFVNEEPAVYDTDDSLDDEESQVEDEELGSEHGSDDEQPDDEEASDEEASEMDLLENEDSEFDEEAGDDTLFKPSKSNQVNYDKELDELDGDEEEESDEANDEMMSEFQKKDAQTQQKAKELEEEYLKEKPWQLKGEVRAGDRPQDSLLEEYVDFESGARPLPVYTEEFTKKLEDLILQRVKTNKYDDVEKKERKEELPFDYKRRILLETEKNKEGLAKLYENEYLKQKGASQKDENPVHKEIKEKMRRLFMQLDSLCNFNYVPKAANSEIKVINNLPAINVEEAIPEAVSDATLIAPQELLPVQKRDLKSDQEKDKTDRLRERRLKKRIIKEKVRFREQQNGSQATNFKKKSKTSDGNDKIKKSAKDSEAVKSVFMKTRKSR